MHFRSAAHGVGLAAPQIGVGLRVFTWQMDNDDGVPARGCDGNLAGGSGNSGATVAQKWWDSIPHRLSLYRPSYTGGTGGVCIYFAMVHGGIPNEPSSFTRAAARWGGC